MDDRTPEFRATTEFAENMNNARSEDNGRGAVGCSLIAFGALIAFLPAIIPGAFGGSTVAGWYLVNTIPFGAIIGLIGIVALATSGSGGNPAATTAVMATTHAESHGAQQPLQLDNADDEAATAHPREDDQPEVFPELPAWFGRAQIGIMALAFLGLSISFMLWVTFDPDVTPSTIGGIYQLPVTIGLLVSLVLALASLRLRFNRERRWSARAYGTLYRIQRAFAVPAYLSILGISTGNSFDLARSLIAMSAHLTCWGMYWYYRRTIATVSE